LIIVQWGEKRLLTPGGADGPAGNNIANAGPFIEGLLERIGGKGKTHRFVGVWGVASHDGGIFGILCTD
jgi:hypothetical protein